MHFYSRRNNFVQIVNRLCAIFRDSAITVCNDYKWWSGINFGNFDLERFSSFAFDDEDGGQLKTLEKNKARGFADIRHTISESVVEHCKTFTNVNF